MKALYAISCICRENLAALQHFNTLDGWSVVVRAIMSPIPKLRTKACFFLSAVAPGDQQVQQVCSVYYCFGTPPSIWTSQKLNWLLLGRGQGGGCRLQLSQSEAGSLSAREIIAPHDEFLSDFPVTFII